MYCVIMILKNLAIIRDVTSEDTYFMKKKIKLVLSVMAIACFIALSSTTANASTDLIRLGIDDVYVYIVPTHGYVESRVVDGHVLVPVRAFFEILGARISWHEESRAAEIKIDGGIGICLRPDAGLQGVSIQSRNIVLDTLLQIIDDRIFIPLSFLTRDLGIDTDFIDRVVIQKVVDEANETQETAECWELGVDLSVYQQPWFSENERLSISNETIEDFSFLASHPYIKRLAISGGTIKSFDYLAENASNLARLDLHHVNISENAGSIPYLENLSHLSVSNRNVFDLIANNAHIDGHLAIGVESARYRDAGTVHVTLEPLRGFVNIVGFIYGGYATTLDISALQNAENLAYINISRDVDEVLNLQGLISLSNLKMLLVPVQHLRGSALDSFRERCIYISWGS